MSYVGIDFDTHAVHLVKLDEDSSAIYTRCELVGLDAFERTRHVRQTMPGSTFWNDVVACAIEEPQGVQKATVAKLKAVQGAVLACIPRDTLVEPMVPARWRTVVGLKGNATKAEVVARVGFLVMEARHDLWAATTTQLDRSEDACDAYCLALAVSRLVETEAA